MRLVEVVMLMGAHCVSPVEHSQMLTDAAKVQCAVVLEKDTDTGSMTVTPPAAASDPQVAAAMARFSRSAGAPDTGSTRIVPAWAPAGSPTTEMKAPAAKAILLPEPIAPPSDGASPEQADATPAAQPARDTPAPAAAKSAPEPEQKVAVLTPPPPKRSPAKTVENKKRPAKVQAAATSRPGQCKAGAVARWYTTTDGRKKYRCVKPTGDSAPDQLY